MAYLKKTDIVDQLIKKIVLQDDSYLDRADSAYLDLANSKGLLVADLQLNPLPFLSKEWLKAYVGLEVCFNNAGLSEKIIHQDDVYIDVYGNKLKAYKEKFDKLDRQITKEILTGDADTPSEYSASFSTIYRS